VGIDKPKCGLIYEQRINQHFIYINVFNQKLESSTVITRIRDCIRDRIRDIYY